MKLYLFEKMVLGKRGNSFLDNLGYGLGALANVQDVLAGFNPKEVKLQTEKLTPEAMMEAKI